MVVKSSDNIIFDENLLNHFYTADIYEYKTRIIERYH